MPDTFTIRPATPEDAAAVTAVLQASYPALMQGHYDPDALAAALPRMTRANGALLASGTYYVAKAAAGPLIGCGGWSFERPGTGAVEPGLAHIRHFGVAPDWTGRGAGRALYARCAAEARAAGASRFECFASLNAVPFYRLLST